MTKVIYHKADFDGIFCREIARKFLPGAELIGWDYNDPKFDVSADDIIYILDLSVDWLMGHPNLIWIDHHKSAIDKYPKTLKGYRIDGVAACRLTWQWFLKGKRDSMGMIWLLPDKTQYIDRLVQEPEAIRLAGEYDIWDKRDPNAELFQHGLRSEEIDFKTLLDWPEEHAGKYTTRLLNQGRGIQYAKTKENESIIKAAGFTIEFEGLKFLAVNHARYNSFLFTAGLTPEHDACFGFCWRDNRWVVSLYHAPGKEHHDLSLIAVKYGGGGHKGACGFSVKILPFLI
jgi:oligoribonuclease NrnB/cAMP/cGMP phosphodiesterase (DHH superfamily)